MDDDDITIAIKADTSAFDTALEHLEARAAKFGDTLAGALKGAIASGKSLEDVLRGLALSLASTAFEAGMKPLANLLNGAFSGLFGGIGNVLPFARGGAFSGAVVGTPTYFPTTSGTAVMGEAGPEAVMPLARGPDGRLGVAGAHAGAARITINIATPDATSFRKSEAQISAAVSRAVARGQRTT